MFCKVFFRSCIIVFSAIMDKTRNFLHCSAKTLYALMSAILIGPFNDKIWNQFTAMTEPRPYL